MIFLVVDALHILCLAIAWPYLLLMLCRRQISTGSILELVGFLPKKRECIWLHANSVSDIKCFLPIIASLRQRYATSDIVLSVRSLSGYQFATALLSSDVAIARAPLDVSLFVKIALWRLQPVVLITVENILWPNRMRLCAKAGVPVVMINAHMSANSFKYLCVLRRALAPVVSALRLVLVAKSQSYDRFVLLGTPENRLRMLPNLKLA